MNFLQNVDFLNFQKLWWTGMTLRTLSCSIQEILPHYIMSSSFDIIFMSSFGDIWKAYVRYNNRIQRNQLTMYLFMLCLSESKTLIHAHTCTSMLSIIPMPLLFMSIVSYAHWTGTMLLLCAIIWMNLNTLWLV